MVAIASNCEPMALEPLYETVDSDAVDALIGSVETRSAGRKIVISFVYTDHDVMIHSNGVVVVRPVGQRS